MRTRARFWVGFIFLLLPQAARCQQAPALKQETIPVPPREIQLPSETPAETLSSPPVSDFLIVENAMPGGWYLATAIGVIKPHLNSRVTSGVPVGPKLPTPVSLPIAPQDWMAMPDIKLGYRFAGTQDELRLRYQGVFSDGSQSFARFDAWGPGIIHSRINFNMADLDYVSREFIDWAMGPAPPRNLDVLFGVRGGVISFESVGFGSQIIFQGMRNTFAGAGPHIGFDYTRGLFGSRVGLYGLLDAAGLIGSVQQCFEDVRFRNNGSIVMGNLSNPGVASGVGTLALEPGIRFVPIADSLFRVSIGYHWERWWFIGHTDVSNAELTFQGIFFRGELWF